MSYQDMFTTLVTVVLTSAVFVLPLAFYGGKAMARLAAIEKQLSKIVGEGEAGVPERCIRHDERLKIVESRSGNLKIRAKRHSDTFDELTGKLSDIERRVKTEE